jgi:hypothetical protein
MFHPAGHPMERGWVGRIDGDHVVHLAAQTLQSFFTGGGAAREHAEYRLDQVVLLAPVLHPPTVRAFDAQDAFAFGNSTAIVSPGAAILRPEGASGLELLLRPTAVVGAGGEVGGFTLLAEARAPGLPVPKDRDFALVLGPSLLTPDEWVPEGFDWDAALAYAAANTTLKPGDVVAGPPVDRRRGAPGDIVELTLEPLGTVHAAIS